MQLYYFGTNLDSAGHYFWKLDGWFLGISSLSFPNNTPDGISLSEYKEWPFNPEEIVKSRRNGDVEFYCVNGYSIIAICGSCKDSRLGSKSVFFVNEIIKKEILIALIKNTPIADQIIKQMSFEVKWTMLLKQENNPPSPK